jgi:hypothetical protein
MLVGLHSAVSALSFSYTNFYEEWSAEEISLSQNRGTWVNEAEAKLNFL